MPRLGESYYHVVARLSAVIFCVPEMGDADIDRAADLRCELVFLAGEAFSRVLGMRHFLAILIGLPHFASVTLRPALTGRCLP